MESKLLAWTPTVLLSAFILKQLVLGTSVSEMGVSFALTVAVVSFEYLSKSRTLAHIEATLSKKVESQDAIISKQNLVIETMAIEISKVKDSIIGVRTAQGAGAMMGLKRTP